MLLLALLLAQVDRVDTVVITGLEWTHRSVVEIEIGYAPGDVVDDAQFSLGLTRLWNTGIFSWVDGHREGRTAYYELRERFFLAPVINFTILTQSSFWVQGGLKDINTFGRFIDVEGAYERFNTVNGGYLAVKQPRLFGKRIELFARIERLSRPRPDFVQLQTRASLQLGALTFSDRLWLQGGVEAAYYEQPFVAWRAALTGSVRIGRIDTLRLRQRGLSAELKPVLGAMFSEARPIYAQAVLELLAFFLLGERVQLAFRVNAGATTRVPSPLLYYVGGLDLVRGYVDNYLRTDAYVVVNAEVRVILFDGLKDWLAIMAVAFVDAAVARSAPSAGAGGLGLRILFPKFPRSGLRVDGAIPLESPTIPQLSFGAFQFF